MPDQPWLRPSWKMLHRLGSMRVEQAEDFLLNLDQVIYAVQVEGALDLDRLALAWRTLQRRHPVMGSSFNLAEERWRVQEPAVSTLTVSQLPADQRDAEAATQELGNVLLRPFDLTRGPLTRLHAVPVGESLSLVGLAADHVACDGWSLHVVFAELWELYQAPDAQLPPVRTTFPAHVAEEYAWLASPAGAAMMERRVKMLADLGPVPAVRPPGVCAGTAGHHLSHTARFTVTQADLGPLQTVSAMRGLAPTALAHAALAAALHLMTGEERLGTLLAVANRAERRLHRTHGWLADNVVVLTRAVGDVRKPRFLDEFGLAVAEALDYSVLSLAAVMAQMEPDQVGRPNQHPSAGFNSGASLETWGRRFPIPAPAGLTLTHVPVPGGWGYKPMVVHAAEFGGGIDVKISVKQRWFESSTAEQLGAQMRELLTDWAAAVK